MPPHWYQDPFGLFGVIAIGTLAIGGLLSILLFTKSVYDHHIYEKALDELVEAYPDIDSIEGATELSKACKIGHDDHKECAVFKDIIVAYE